MYRTKKYSQLHPRVSSPRVPHQKRNLLFGAALFAVNLLFGELGRVDRQFDLFAILDLATLDFSLLFMTLPLIYGLAT
jgi:hypothetical protein